MKQITHLIDTVCKRRSLPRETSQLPGLILGLLLLSLANGCGENEVTVGLSVPAELEINSGIEENFPDLMPAQWRIDSHDGSGTLPGGGSGRTRLASFVMRSQRPIEWNFGGFDDVMNPQGDRPGSHKANTLVQAPALPSAPKGLEDESEAVGPVQVVATPPGRPEVKAELIPTPQGYSERKAANARGSGPVARIAADVEGSSASKLNKKSSPLEAGVPSEKVPEQADLIDPNTEVGLAGTENGPEDYRKWPAPDAVLFITGNQHGYIEPCGCTGLEKQKGGVARRFTFIKQLRDMGWPLIPVDAGNQIRRIGQQASIKFEKSSSALTQMEYQAVGFGPGDMRLSAGDLISVTYADSPEDAMYVSGNIVLLDPSLLPSHKVVRQGEWNVGLTSILDPDALEAPVEEEVVIGPIKESATKVLKEMNAAGANFRVVTFFGEEKVAKQLMVDVPGYDLIVVSGGYGEPTYRPQTIEGSEAKMIVTGNKGMFAGLVALYQNQPMKYARVPLTHEFKDAPEMRKLMADYQQQLQQLGLSGLGLSPIPHPSTEKFVGTETCAKCHKSAFEVWESSGHAEATAHIVEPSEGRGDVPRHFDPECISCHVTGWNAQNYYPYESGYLSLEQSAHLTGSGCENCHGPGAGHSAAEEENSGVSEERKKSLRLAMQLPLEKAKELCMTCHDLDNSPDFHDEDAFEDNYWPEVEHYGLD